MRPKTFYADEHEIDPSRVDQDAIWVVERLRHAGFEAYLVGGSVRDLLSGRTPKDYDISTSARPEEIKDLFRRRCLLIGRRFRLAHIRCGKKVFEVSTFRSGDNDSDLIIRDNTWGTPEEDVLRRDFTINGLFLDPTTHTVIDYVGGWDDIHQHVLRSIGDPYIRFKQDPVRMIRLLKFRARFGFGIEEVTKQALLNCQTQITKSAPARILEEMFRMLESGYASRFFHLMTRSGLLKHVFSSLHNAFDTHLGNEVFRYLDIIDQINSKKTMKRSVLTSALLFPFLKDELKGRIEQSERPLGIGELLLLTAQVVKNFVTASFSRFPKKLSLEIHYILSTQYRLTPIHGNVHHRQKLFRNRNFSKALLFLKVRSAADPKLFPIYQGWSRSYKQYLKEGSHQERHHHPPPYNVES